jgi:hypothetical protein
MVAVVGSLPSAASAQFGNLTQRIPDRANALMLVDLEKAYASPLGTREGWRQKLEKAFSDGLVILPPQANQFALAAELDFDAMRPKWEVAVMDLAYEPSVPKAASRLGGTVDNIEGEEAVRLRDTSYLVKFGPRIAAALAPATRRDVGRWINQVHASETGALSPYLKESIKYVEGNSAVILIMQGLESVTADVRRRMTEKYKAEF